MVEITAVYAALLGLLFVMLSVRVVRARRAERVALGDGDSVRVRRAMRVQANFAEYAPMAILLIAFGEMGGAPGWRVHALCLALLAGRFVHAWGVSQPEEDFRFRVAGMALTFVALVGAALSLLVDRLA